MLPSLNELRYTIRAYALVVVVVLLGARFLRELAGDVGDLNFASFVALLWRYRNTDFATFMRSHRESLAAAYKTGDYVKGVCNYYTLMADAITLTTGPFWHFVPMYRHLSRRACHKKFHRTLTEYVEAKKGDDVLELGCGFGEMGRQVAKLSGACCTGLTMAELEVSSGNKRIKDAGLEKQCKIVQGNYHNMPFESDSFHNVFGVYTLKYSSDIDKAIAEAFRVLKPGGKFVSYEILVTDKYDSSNTMHSKYVENISTSTCMPPLWHAQAFRDAARKAGFIEGAEADLCGPESGADSWYTCFERTRIHTVLSSTAVSCIVKLLEGIHVLPASFSDWYENCVVHPATDFVYAGRLGIVTGSVMMTWKKP